MEKNASKKAKKFITNSDIFRIITEDEFDKTISGELKTRQAIFLMNCSTWVNGAVLHTFVGGESSAGKDHNVKNILKIFPEDRIITRSKITPQAFTYWHEEDKDWTWENKIVYVSDVENNLLNAPVFKAMASEGTSASTVRNGKTVDIEIQGIPNLVVTTAEANPINEILNRFNLVSLDESKEQTRAILDFIAKRATTNEKIFYSEDVVEGLALLKNVNVVVPFAEKMVEYIPGDFTKMRRVAKNFINLIKSSTALHQFQRDADAKGNLIATKQDYEIAKSVIGNIQEDTISGLTAKHKRYLIAFEKLEDNLYNMHEIYEKTNDILALQNWYPIMEELALKGVVDMQEEKDEFTGKFVRKYKKISAKNQEFILPEFEKISF